jgi:hypothetical protein
MTFSYVLTADIGKVRFELGDTSSGSGVRSDGTNLSDEELQMLIDREGTVSLAVAAACEMLSRDWARAASVTVGPRSEQLGQVSGVWAKRALDIRGQTGGGDVSFSVGFSRSDGYSEHAAEVA